jgi:hypothetical protein
MELRDNLNCAFRSGVEMEDAKSLSSLSTIDAIVLSVAIFFKGKKEIVDKVTVSSVGGVRLNDRYLKRSSAESSKFRHTLNLIPSP